MSSPDIREYQKLGVDFLRQTGRCILGDDPGLGKSRQLIEAATEPALVVAPAMLRQVWADEVARWRPSFDYTFVSYSSLCLRTENDHGRLSKVNPIARPEYRQRWATLICDEAHYLKGRSTNWSLAVLDLSRKHADQVYLATGTPVPNWAHEIFMLLRVLHPTDKRFTNYRRWLRQHFELWQPQWGGLVVKPHRSDYDWAPFIRENSLDTTMLRRTRAEALPELPPLTETVIEVPMTPEQARLYKAVKKDFLAWTDAGNAVQVWSSGGLHTKLMKICTGPEIVDPDASPGSKSKALAELLEDRPHTPILILTLHRATASQMAKVATTAGRAVALITGDVTQRRRNELIGDFRAGVVDTIVGTIDTLAEGLTLTEADTCIFVEHSWRPSRNEQAMRRIHRLGQDKPVSVIHLVTSGTVDVPMMRRLQFKEDQQLAMLTAHEFAQML